MIIVAVLAVTLSQRVLYRALYRIWRKDKFIFTTQTISRRTALKA